MSYSPRNDFDDQITEQSQAKDYVSIQPNEEADNLEDWLDNFIAEARDLERKNDEGNGESSEKKLTSEEEISAWADKILNGESSDEEEDFSSHGQQNDGESTENTDGKGNHKMPITQKARSSISITISTEDEDNDKLIEGNPKLTPVGPLQDKEDDNSRMERESNPTAGESGNAVELEHNPAAIPPLPSRNSRSSISFTINVDDDGGDEVEHTGEKEPEDMTPESTSNGSLEAKAEDSVVQIKSNHSDDKSENSENKEHDPSNNPSPLKQNSKSSVSITISDEDKDTAEASDHKQAEEDEPAKEILESKPVPVGNEDASLEIGTGSNQNDGESDTSISNDRDDRVEEDEPSEGIRVSVPVEHFDNDDDSSGAGISSYGTGGESGNTPATTSPPPNPKARSSISISISDEEDDANERTGNNKPDGKVRKSFDHEVDDSGGQIAGCETDGEGEIKNAGHTQPEPDPSRPPRNHRKKSSVSITISNQDDGPHGGVMETTPADPNDNENDSSGMGIYDATDWDEIDLNSDSDEEEGGPTPETVTDGINSEEFASYLKAYIDSLYIFGVSTRDGNGKSFCGRWNLIPFLFVAFVALLQAFQFVKNTIVNNLKENILLHYIKLGYNMNTFLFRGYFAYLMIFKPSALGKVIKAGRELGKCNSKIKAVWSMGFLALSSWIFGFSYPMIETISRFPGEWDLEDVITTWAYDFAQTWLAWNKTTFDNDTQTLWETYGLEMTNTAILMGTSNIAIDVIGFIYEFLIKDFAFVAAFSMYLVCHDFSQKLDNTQLSEEICDELWNHYKLLRTFSKELNDLLEQLFQLLHLDNLLFTAYVSFQQFFTGGDIQLGALQICILVKVICFYVFAAKAASVNRKFEQWVRSSFRGPNTMFIENSEKVATQNLLDEIKSDPIGIGRGMFFIDGSFVWKFISIVGSFFVFFSEKRQTV